MGLTTGTILPSSCCQSRQLNNEHVVQIAVRDSNESVFSQICQFCFVVRCMRVLKCSSLRLVLTSHESVFPGSTKARPLASTIAGDLDIMHWQ